MPEPAPQLSQPEYLRLIETGSRDEYVERHAEATGAVARLNRRVGAWATFYFCVRDALARGDVPAGCTDAAAATLAIKD